MLYRRYFFIESVAKFLYFCVYWSTIFNISGLRSFLCLKKLYFNNLSISFLSWENDFKLCSLAFWMISCYHVKNVYNIFVKNSKQLRLDCFIIAFSLYFSNILTLLSNYYQKLLIADYPKLKNGRSKKYYSKAPS